MKRQRRRGRKQKEGSRNYHWRQENRELSRTKSTDNIKRLRNVTEEEPETSPVPETFWLALPQHGDASHLLDHNPSLSLSPSSSSPHLSPPSLSPLFCPFPCFVSVSLTQPVVLHLWGHIEDNSSFSSLTSYELLQVGILYCSSFPFKLLDLDIIYK